MKLIKIILKVILGLVCFVLLVGTVFYINTTIYNFPEPKPFQGAFIYNPYGNLPDSSYRANFHAHTELSNKVTNGHNTEEEMFEAYIDRGYDMPGISNYHSISTYGKDRIDIYIPCYEHGYNILKSHCLGIGVDEVSKFDYPLIQSSSHQQKIIENIKAKNGFVTMAHPKFGGGRDFDNMRDLTYYEFTEVLNHYRISDEYWDAALSAGRLTSIMGNDDTHDIINEPTFRIWNVIHSEVRHADSILAAMRLGKNYGVWSHNELWDNKLKHLNLITPNTFELALDEPADSIKLIGQDGVQLHMVQNQEKVRYQFKDTDTYVRAVAYNENSHLYFNPLVRYDGQRIPLNSDVKPEVNNLLSWLAKIFFAGLSLLWVVLLVKIIRW